MAEIRALRSATDAANDDVTADKEAGTLMKLTPKKEGKGFTGFKMKDNRYLSKLSLPTNSISSNAEEQTELDSHADTCIAGQNYVVQHFTEVTCELYPYIYDKSYYEPQVVPILYGITAYDHA
eukprot:scaffold130937_cov21-Attheya_sp.AAC.1